MMNASLREPGELRNKKMEMGAIGNFTAAWIYSNSFLPRKRGARFRADLGAVGRKNVAFAGG